MMPSLALMILLAQPAPPSAAQAAGISFRAQRPDDRDIVSARTTKDASRQPSVTVRLSPDGLKKLNALMAAHRGERLAIVVGDRVVMSAMMVGGPLTKNEFEIAGGLMAKSAAALAKALNKRGAR